jgi:DNA-binding Lrp family transcriptional regulator
VTRASFIWSPSVPPDADGLMETLYLLVEIELGTLDEVVGRLKAVPGVTEVQAVTGPFDLIVKVQAPQINEALDTVVHRIRRIDGIKSTETLVTVATG